MGRRRKSQKLENNATLEPIVDRGPPRIGAQELIDMIIDFLHDSPASLLSCALVCSAWVPSSQLHLFRDVRMRANYESDPRLRSLPSFEVLESCTQFAACLRGSVHLIPLVCTLIVDAYVSTIRELAKVPFTHLYSLTLHSGRNSLRLDKEAGAESRQHLSSILSIPTLIHIEVVGISLPSSIFRMCRNVKSLVLVQVSIGDWGFIGPQPKPEAALSGRLETVRLRGCSFNWLTSNSAGWDFSHLKHLDLRHIGRIPRVLDFIQSISLTLEYLALDVDIPELDLGILPNLKYLEWYLNDELMEADTEPFRVLPTLSATHRVGTIIFWISNYRASRFDADVEVRVLPGLTNAKVHVEEIPYTLYNFMQDCGHRVIITTPE
ncbi:hypothetical protein C8F04DRAFT_455179 [Mycena alexandri]|uniref:Uncharacterized protein n=1 Tax=Mycena alexandri TaxID=1745969 RepID=A0AAD6XI11_9AGAR|nr:hypothetical protein C8F04DRAFT_455179 [Mycena alexandri]